MTLTVGEYHRIHDIVRDVYRGPNPTYPFRDMKEGETIFISSEIFQVSPEVIRMSVYSCARNHGFKFETKKTQKEIDGRMVLGLQVKKLLSEPLIGPSEEITRSMIECGSAIAVLSGCPAEISEQLVQDIYRSMSEEQKKPKLNPALFHTR